MIHKSLFIFLVAVSTAHLTYGQNVTYSSPVGIIQVELSEGRHFVGVPFGVDNASLSNVLVESFLPASNVQSSATAVDLWNQDEQTLTNRYWLSNASGFEGWRELDTFDEAGQVPIPSSSGMIITIREGQGSVLLPMFGRVPISASTAVIVSNGYSLVSMASPAVIALTNAGLIESGFQGGSSYVTSDNVLLYNSSSDTFDVKLWYDESGSTWRYADASPASPSLLPGQSFLIRRRARADNLFWTNRLPYTIP